MWDRGSLEIIATMAGKQMSEPTHEAPLLQRQGKHT
jgi:hypothetical protein